MNANRRATRLDSTRRASEPLASLAGQETQLIARQLDATAQQQVSRANWRHLTDNGRRSTAAQTSRMDTRLGSTRSVGVGEPWTLSKARNRSQWLTKLQLTPVVVVVGVVVVVMSPSRIVVDHLWQTNCQLDDSAAKLAE